MIRFDAYSATTVQAKAPQLIELLRESSGCGDWHKLRQGKGFHTFGERVGVVNEQGAEWASVMWGGRQGDRVMVEVKGERTPGAAQALRERYEHRCTRVDACADFDAPGSFDRLYAACITVKAVHRLKGEKQGDWEDFPEEGRTLYLGSRASAVRVRLYEKGKQPDYRHLQRPDWTRIEVQVRPAKDAKHDFAELTPSQVWGASTWSRELACKVLEEHIDPHPAGTVYRLTQRDRALQWMCRQYGPHLVSLADDLGGWKEVGLTLLEMIREQAARKH